MPGIKSVVQLTQSITGKCNEIIKEELLDDLFLNDVDANGDKLQVNFGQVGQTRSKLIVTGGDNASLVKSMFGKIKRRGTKDKRTVTNMYSMVVILDGEKERNAMLDQPTQRTNK